MTLSSRQSKLDFLIWLRAIATLCILLCHYLTESTNVYFAMGTQLFSIGVPLFFAMSGFLFGYRGVRKPYSLWFWRRIVRIGLPYWLFLLTLAIVYICLERNILTFHWLALVFWAQGSDVGVLGAEHTWFISAIAICYLATPMISLLNEKFCKADRRYIWLVVLLLCFVTVILAVIPQNFVYTLLSPVCLYAFAFVVGSNLSKVRITQTGVRVAFVLIVASVGGRLLGRALCDGSILYDRLIVSYTEWVTVFCLAYICAFFLWDRQTPKVIRIVNDYSFEVYLYHYMLTVGPISLFGLTPWWGIDCLIVTAVTLGVAFVANYISRWLYRSRRFRKNDP